MVLPKKSRVLVAMSGGVDSSVAAALLVEQGYDVVGVTMQVWDYSDDSCAIEEGHGTCCSSVDVDDARSVADKLGFPFYVMNCEAKFKSYVIDSFISDYLDGRTPVPCVHCNTYLKFDHLFEKMTELDCDFLATGHYASIQTDDNAQPIVVTSTDDWKDQTYFLFTLKPEHIAKLMFPIGHLKKPAVREIAEKQKLGNARKKDSTGICFIGKNGYADFIKQHTSTDLLKTGSFRRFPSGEIIGEHEGIHKFTYGQRRGLGLNHHEPLFVISLDPKSATVWVGEEKYLFHGSARVKQMNWLTNIKPEDRVRVKIRYQHEGAFARLEILENSEIIVRFEEPQRAITPGQAAVIYKENILVGGGWIVGQENGQS